MPDAADVAQPAEPTPPRRRRWPLFAVGALAYVAVAVGVFGMLFFAVRADGRAERAGRTACTLTVVVGDLASSFDRTLGMLSGATRETAEAEMRDPLERARAVALLHTDECVP